MKSLLLHDISTASIDKTFHLTVPLLQYLTLLSFFAVIT